VWRQGTLKPKPQRRFNRFLTLSHIEPAPSGAALITVKIRMADGEASNQNRLIVNSNWRLTTKSLLRRKAGSEGES